MTKGPSFGAEFAMASPQIFIAHFGLLSTPQGRATLAARLHRDMLRISTGIEDDPTRVIETLDHSFRTAST